MAAAAGEDAAEAGVLVLLHGGEVQVLDCLLYTSYEFYKKYDFDFVKTMNNGMYAIEDFGCTVDYSEIVKGGVAKVVSTPISCAADWRKLTAVSYTHLDVYKRQGGIAAHQLLQPPGVPPAQGPPHLLFLNGCHILSLKRVSPL